MKHISLILAAAITTQVCATVNLTVDAGALRDSAGDFVAAGSIALIVADFSNDGILDFLNTTLSTNSFIGGGTDDQILGVASVVTSSGFPSFTTGVTYEYSGDFGVGDNIYVAWFPTITIIGSTVTAGTSYGLYRTSSIDLNSGSEIAWIAPADGGAYNLFAYDNTIAPGAVATTSDFTASLTAVPEPATFAALAGMATLGLAVVRRRKRAV